MKKPSKRKKNRISKTPVKTKNQSEHTSLPDKNIFPVVGIGASAGGLEAMEQFFENTNSFATLTTKPEPAPNIAIFNFFIFILYNFYSIKLLKRHASLIPIFIFLPDILPPAA